MTPSAMNDGRSDFPNDVHVGLMGGIDEYDECDE